MVIDTIWPAFLNIIREEIGSRVVETWFKAIVFCKWDAHQKIVFLQAPNDFVKEWVSTHYLYLFERHLGRLLHEHAVHISFVESNQQSKTEITEPIIHQPLRKETLPQHRSVKIKPAVPAVARPIQRVKQPTINQLYRFHNFIVGPHNSLAYAAAHAISEKPGKLYNPFFIYGDSGLGKTHLLHAIGNEIKEKHQQARILYQGADRFVQEFISAIRFDKVYQFEAKYKDVDTLLIDDVQFLSNKEQTQEAFFHIFNSLYQAQKQIVFTSDSLPSDIAGLAHRMRSRLESGLVTDISQPTLETKIAIVKKKAETHHEVMSDEVADYIASTVVSNVRELEGAIIKVFAYASLMQQPLTLELAQQVLARSKEYRQESLDLQKIGTRVAQYFDYSLQDIRSAKRDKDLTLARHVTIYFMKQLTGYSLREISKFLQKKDHSTILHALEKVEALKKDDAKFTDLLKNIERQVTQ